MNLLKYLQSIYVFSKYAAYWDQDVYNNEINKLNEGQCIIDRVWGK